MQKDVFTVLSGATIGNLTFNRVYVMPNVFKTKKAIRNELPKLFNNCTIFIAKDTIWIIKIVLCYKVLEQLEKQTGQFGIVICNDKAIPGNTVCNCCKYCVDFYLGECDKKSFYPTERRKNTMFLKLGFKKYMKIEERHVLSKMYALISEEYGRRIKDLKFNDRAMNKIRNDYAQQLGKIMMELKNQETKTFNTKKNKATMYFDLGR